VAATEQVLLKFEPTQLADVDRIRGEIPRQVFIKDMLQAAVLARDAFDGPCYLRVRATERKGPQREGVHMFLALPFDD
jgi:hypothetical protein